MSDAPIYWHDLDAERALLGAWLLNPARLIEHDVPAELFYARHQDIARALRDPAHVHRPLGSRLVAVAAQLQAGGLLDEIGGAATLEFLLTCASTDVERDVARVRQCATRRATDPAYDPAAPRVLFEVSITAEPPR